MKRRGISIDDAAGSGEDGLARALLTLRTEDEMCAFLHDLCTPAELEALTDRWRVVPYLLDGRPYREIHDLTAVSITTIGRVARCINDGNGGYLAAASSRSRRRPADTQGAHA